MTPPTPATAEQIEAPADNENDVEAFVLGLPEGEAQYVRGLARFLDTMTPDQKAAIEYMRARDAEDREEHLRDCGLEPAPR